MAIELGDKVKCKYTGFTGVAVSKCIFINGCVQYEVAPKVNKDGKMEEAVGIDEESLVVVKANGVKIPKKTAKKPTGGANSKAIVRRNY